MPAATGETWRIAPRPRCAAKSLPVDGHRGHRDVHSDACALRRGRGWPNVPGHVPTRPPPGRRGPAVLIDEHPEPAGRRIEHDAATLLARPLRGRCGDAGHGDPVAVDLAGGGIERRDPAATARAGRVAERDAHDLGAGLVEGRGERGGIVDDLGDLDDADLVAAEDAVI